MNLKVLPEGFIEVWVLICSRECEWMLGGGPLMFAYCTHIILTLTKILFTCAHILMCSILVT